MVWFEDVKLEAIVFASLPFLNLSVFHSFISPKSHSTTHLESPESISRENPATHRVTHEELIWSDMSKSAVLCPVDTLMAPRWNAPRARFGFRSSQRFLFMENRKGEGFSNSALRENGACSSRLVMSAIAKSPFSAFQQFGSRGRFCVIGVFFWCSMIEGFFLVFDDWRFGFWCWKFVKIDNEMKLWIWM